METILSEWHVKKNILNQTSKSSLLQKRASPCSSDLLARLTFNHAADELDRLQPKVA